MKTTAKLLKNTLFANMVDAGQCTFGHMDTYVSGCLIYFDCVKAFNMVLAHMLPSISAPVLFGCR